MALDFEGLLTFALVVLPGLVARAEAQRVAPIPEDKTQRGTLQELADALVYSAFIAIGVGLISLLILAAATGGKRGLADLVQLGVGGLLRAAPNEGVIALIAYVILSLAAAELIGANRMGATVRAWVEDHLAKTEGLSDDPIWWTVLDTRLRQAKKSEVFLNIRLNEGGLYSGVLLHFPVVGDDQADKDFAIWKARHYTRDGKLVELEPDEVVLLNTRSCGAIEVRYADPVTLQS